MGIPITGMFEPSGGAGAFDLYNGAVVQDNTVLAAALAATATDKVFGRATAGAGAGEEIACTAAGRALLDDANSTAQRTTLGLGSMAVQAEAGYAFLAGRNGGQILYGGSGASEGLSLQSTSHVTKGTVTVATVTFDASGNIGAVASLAGAAAIPIKASGDNDDYLQFQTTAGVPGLKVIGDPAVTLESDDASQVILEIKDDATHYMDVGFYKVDGSEVGYLYSPQSICLYSSGDADDYIKFQTIGSVPEITTVGSCDLKITSSSGAITFDNENLTTTGTMTATTFIGALTGSCSGNAATVTTNANLTGPITSVGNATSIASQTGTGTKFVVDTGPTISDVVLTTSAKIPNGAGSAGVDAAGKIAVDTTLKSLIFYSDEKYAVSPRILQTFPLEYVHAAENRGLWYTRVAITIRQISVFLLGSVPTVTWSIVFAAARNEAAPTNCVNSTTCSAAACSATTTGHHITAFNDATIPAGNFIWFLTTATTGRVDEMHLTIEYTIDP